MMAHVVTIAFGTGLVGLGFLVGWSVKTLLGSSETGSDESRNTEEAKRERESLQASAATLRHLAAMLNLSDEALRGVVEKVTSRSGLDRFQPIVFDTVDTRSSPAGRR